MKPSSVPTAGSLAATATAPKRRKYSSSLFVSISNYFITIYFSRFLIL